MTAKKGKAAKSKANNAKKPADKPAADQATMNPTNQPPADQDNQGTANQPPTDQANQGAPAPPAAEKAKVKPAGKSAAKDPEKKTRFDVARAKKVFASHKVDVIHFTSDGQVFIEPQYARIHSENLKDKEIIHVTRKEVE